MKFEQRIIVNASPAEVRALLENVPAAAACIPGVESVVPADEPASYDGRVRVRVGPLSFTIAGRARLDRADDGAWRLTGEGRDARVGAGVTATLETRLEPITVVQTALDITADVQFSGRLAELGQAIIRRKAEQMLQEFGVNLRRKVEGESG